jgi:RND family efflux transporter MFP subunit
MKQTTTLLMLLALLLTACSQKKQTDNDVQYVKTAKAQRLGDAAEMSYPGRTKANEEVNAAFRVSGTIQRVMVKEGDYVRKGQVIAQMDPRDYQVQLQATQAEYAQVKAEAERVMAVFEEGSTTAAANDRARYGLQQITQKLANHRNQLADTRLVSPVSGYVQQKFHESGETVSAGMPIVRLMGGTDVEIEIHVPASDYARQEQFSSATCSFEVLPGETFPLRVVSMSKEANASQLYTLRLGFKGDYDHSRITPGMSTMVYATFHQPNERNIVKVPSTAILHKNDRTTVFVVNKQNSTVEQRDVELGALDLDGNIQVVKGLKPDETVVTAGVRYLTHGQRVKEIEPTSKANVGGLL